MNGIERKVRQRMEELSKEFDNHKNEPIMPDISMCSGQDCPLKEKCYRYTAPKSEFWQSWFGNVPYNHEKEKCEYFWDNHYLELEKQK